MQIGNVGVVRRRAVLEAALDFAHRVVSKETHQTTAVARVPIEFRHIVTF